jgi:hypothetical protein
MWSEPGDERIYGSTYQPAAYCCICRKKVVGLYLGARPFTGTVFRSCVSWMYSRITHSLSIIAGKYRVENLKGPLNLTSYKSIILDCSIGAVEKKTEKN